MARRSKRGGGALPHSRYGATKVPDTYIEPFVAYRAWNWDAEGITSLNASRWTPKLAFEATCIHREEWKLMMESGSPEARGFWKAKEHHCPDAACTCGMYAGINMQHLIDIEYIQRGIHGEVSLWGRLERCTLGWRAQYAYPKYFVVPVDMIPFDMAEAQQRLATLVEFDVDIYIQMEREARVGQEKIPLWVKDFGYSQQGLSLLVEKRKQWYLSSAITPIAVGDRVAVFSRMETGSGIGIVREIKDGDMYYTMFSPDVIYRKPVKDVKWNEKNWRWETTGVGGVRRLR